jgi:hypothetical protein
MGTLTGVGTVISASHKDRDTGVLHGHSWEVIAWFVSGNAVRLQEDLKQVCATFDHSVFADELAWAENFGAHILRCMGVSCVEIDVNRPLERVFAKITRD